MFYDKKIDTSTIKYQKHNDMKYVIITSSYQTIIIVFLTRQSILYFIITSEYLKLNVNYTKY